MRTELKALLAAALAVYLAGIWWGVPWLWAPDELGPGIIFDAIDARFAGGWYDKYPPLQYYLGAIAYLPFLAAAMGCVLSERGGVVNVALEGTMLVGALFAVLGTTAFGSPCRG